MPTGFSQVLASIEPSAGAGFSVTVPPDWLQGRTVFGGMQMAMGGRAMRAVLPVQAAAMPLRGRACLDGHAYSVSHQTVAVFG